MKRFLSKKLRLAFFLKGVFLSLLFVVIFIPGRSEAAFNPTSILPDSQFVAFGSMSQSDIQNLLNNKNSYLKDYIVPYDAFIGPNNDINVNGWNASQIVYNTSQWYKINPQVILATLQKESSLITTSNPSQSLMDWAMGYGCPDGGGCNDRYRGFASQVDWGSWQLKYNYDMANNPSYYSRVAPYYKGNTVIIDGDSTLLGNATTASLYRYTPHFHGNQNFYTIYNQWFAYYDYVYWSAKNPPTVWGANQYVSVRITLKNTGTATWYNDDLDKSNPVRLNVISGNELASDDGSWKGDTRIRMTTPEVPPGAKGNFYFTLKTPPNIGKYNIRFIPIVENNKSLKDVGMQFSISTAPWIGYEYVSAKPPPAKINVGDEVNVRIVLKNTGSAVWKNDSNSVTKPMRLMVLGGKYLEDPYTWKGDTRIRMTTSVVKYGELATFNFKIKPTVSGQYNLRFIPIIENVTVLKDVGMSFSTFVKGQLAVYRFWSDSKQTHFYTADVKEKDSIVRNLGNIWSYEKVAYNAYNSPKNITKPVYRFWSDSKQKHFYTADWDERTNVVNNLSHVWKLEGVSYHVLKTGGYPVYRFWSDSKQGHFYTANEFEKRHIIRNYFDVWAYEGVAWRVPKAF